MYAKQEAVENDERFIVPAPRASACSAKNSAPVITCEVEGSGGVRVLVAGVLVLESSETLLQDDVGLIRRSDPTVEARPVILGRR